VKKDWLSQGYVLHYSFNDWMGTPYRGRKILFQKEAFTWRHGEEGEVRYDRNDPRINVWIGRGFEFNEDEKMVSVPATVVGVAERNGDGENEVVVRYRYRDHLGAIHEDQLVEKQGVLFKQGDTGKVQFDLWHPGLNLWLGKSERDKESAGAAKPLRSSSASPETPVFPRAPVPSPFTLFRRCIPMRRALANFVWFLFYGLLLLGAIILTADQPSEEALLGLTVASLLVAFLLFGVVRNWIKGVRELRVWRRLLDSGSPIEGTITVVEEQRERWGRLTWKPGWIVSYRYESPNGRFYYGDSGYLTRKEAADWRIRDKCVVLYDHEEPSKSVWIGKS
jgi:hypothetical protein